MLLGMRDGLEHERQQTFLETGTVHLLVVSGLHVGILAAGLYFVGRILSISEGALRAGCVVRNAVSQQWLRRGFF